MRLVPFDESKHADFVLHSFDGDQRRSRYGRQRLAWLFIQGKQARHVFWSEACETISALFRDPANEVRVAVDSEDDSIIFGWSCVAPGVVHYVVVKRELVREGFANDVLALVLPELTQGDMVCTMEIPGLLDLVGRLPVGWKVGKKAA